MKLYDFTYAPNCRRVRIFAAEKGIAMDCVPVDILKQEQLSEDYARINERLTLPVLVLDDGTRLTESAAICRYFEEIRPDPPLYGSDPLSKARVEAWHRRVELEGLQAAAEVLRNSSPRFAGRALPGPMDFPQIHELAERGARRLAAFFSVMDRRLADAPYLAGEVFSVADVLGLVVVDFAARVGQPAPEEAANLARWHRDVSARPSAAA